MAGGAAGAGGVAGAVAGAGGAGWAAGAASCALVNGAVASCVDTKPNTSFLVIRPPVPVPLTRERSTPCSFANFRTSGDKICDRGPRSGSALCVGAAICEGTVSAEAAAGDAAGV
jgi:hypothetical protein